MHRRLRDIRFSRCFGQQNECLETTLGLYLLADHDVDWNSISDTYHTETKCNVLFLDDNWSQHYYCIIKLLRHYTQACRQEMKWGGGAFCKKVDLTPTKWNETESNFAFLFYILLNWGCVLQSRLLYDRFIYLSTKLSNDIDILNVVGGVFTLAISEL